MQRWKKKPILMDEFQTFLQTTPVDENQIRGLAEMIGETAAPQDVDLSLMVLASHLARQGHDVVLVSDDYKMTTTAQKANLQFTTCPPSTFLQRLAESGPANTRSRVRSLSRRVRAAEMRYAISRAGQYDIQSKLTWMVDSLIQSKASQPSPTVTDTSANEDDLVNALKRHMAGERVKAGRIKSLGPLPVLCAPFSELDNVLSSLASIANEQGPSVAHAHGSSSLSDALEPLGIGLTPLNDEMATIAHRAIAGPICRMETTLGLLSRLCGDIENARLHLARALHQATLIDDDKAEIKTMQHLGMIALASNDNKRAAHLFEAAAAEAHRIEEPRLVHLVSAAIGRHLSGGDDQAEIHISAAHKIVETNQGEGALTLKRLGEGLLAIGRPGLALEVLDEAMECAAEGAEELLERISDLILMSNAAIVDEEVEVDPSLREILDKINEISEEAASEFEKQITKIEEKELMLDQTAEETWNEWQPSSRLIPEGEPLVVLRVEENDDGDILIITHHPDHGALGLWLPESGIDAGIGHRIELGSTRVKVAEPPAAVRDAQHIRAIIAVEDPNSIHLIAPSIDL